MLKEEANIIVFAVKDKLYSPVLNFKVVTIIVGIVDNDMENPTSKVVKILTVRLTFHLNK